LVDRRKAMKRFSLSTVALACIFFFGHWGYYQPISQTADAQSVQKPCEQQWRDAAPAAFAQESNAAPTLAPAATLVEVKVDGEEALPEVDVPTLEFVPDNAPVDAKVKLRLRLPRTGKISYKLDPLKFGTAGCGTRCWWVFSNAGDFTAIGEAYWLKTPDAEIEPFKLVAKLHRGPAVIPSLRELAGDDAKPMAERLYSKLLNNIAKFVSADHFNKVYGEGIRAEGFEGNAALPRIDEALAIAVGSGPVKLDAAAQAKLADCLKLIISELGAEPTPPDPTPGPGPGPVVVAAKLWLVAIDAAEQQTPLQTVALTDTAYWNSQRAKGHDFREYETGSDDAARYAAAIKFPAELIVMDAANAHLLGVEELPAALTTAWFDSIIAKYSGAK
jgi:hypothetical protein